MKGDRSTLLVFFKEVKLRRHHCLCDLDGEQIYLRLQVHAMVISRAELMASHCKPQSEQK